MNSFFSFWHWRTLKVAACASFELPIIFLVFYCCKVFGFVIYVIRADRIGHFVPDAAEAIIRRQIGPERPKRLYVFGSKPVNKQWARMVRSSLPMLPCVRFRNTYRVKLPFLGQVFFNATQTSSRDINSFFSKYDYAQIRFSEEENLRGRAWLKKRGVKPNAKFVCLLSRDTGYLSTYGDNKHQDFSYHNYRNSEIESYAPAIQSITKRGYKVIRVGRAVDKKLNLKNQDYIEYCHDPEQSDFLDIWLVANCTAMISTGTGHDVLASIYRKPLLLVNFLPLISIHAFHEIMAFPKKLSWALTGKPLTVMEQLTAAYFESSKYEEAGIVIDDLTARQLDICCREFIDFFESGNPEIERLNKMQSGFWTAFKSHENFHKYHKLIHPLAVMSKHWLDGQKITTSKTRI